MASGIRANICSGNGLLPDGTKPLPEPMLPYQYSTVTFIGEQFPKRYPSHTQTSMTSISWKITCLKISLKSSRCHWVNMQVLVAWHHCRITVSYGVVLSYIDVKLVLNMYDSCMHTINPFDSRIDGCCAVVHILDVSQQHVGGNIPCALCVFTM